MNGWISKRGFLTIRLAVALLAFIASFSACNKPAQGEAPVVVTIQPLKLILQEIIGDGAEVVCILPPGASPHTFELRPSTARLLSEAKAVFYVDDSIDGWVTRSSLSPPHAVFALVPVEMRLDLGAPHNHSTEEGETPHGEQESTAANAHFWSDPQVVRAIVPELVSILSSLDPAAASRFEANGQAFMESLSQLDQALQAERPDAQGYGMVAFHPSWDYFFHRYDIHVSAYMEPFPGKEPTPRALQDLQRILSRHERRVVLSEVQLPAKPAEVLAESLGATVTVIDPLGGLNGRDTYAGLLRYNANLIWSALK